MDNEENNNHYQIHYSTYLRHRPIAHRSKYTTTSAQALNRLPHRIIYPSPYRHQLRHGNLSHSRCPQLLNTTPLYKENDYAIILTGAQTESSDGRHSPVIGESLDLFIRGKSPRHNTEPPTLF